MTDITQRQTVRWTVSVPKELDIEIRAYLESHHHGSQRGALSKFVEESVTSYINSELIEEGRLELARSGFSDEDLDKLLDSISK